MPEHPVHLPVAPLFEPCLQPGLVLGQVDAREADLLESQGLSPRPDPAGYLDDLGVAVWDVVGHGGGHLRCSRKV